MRRQFILLILLIPVGLLAQQEVVVNGMTFSYQLLDQEIEITLKAPTSGWVGVGFNSENNIVKSDLLLFNIVDGKTTSLDMWVKGFGNPLSDQVLGGTNDISHLKGKEQNGYTTVTFRLPFPSTDQFDFEHRLGQSFWLILAYSTHDEFDHHSRMRKHMLFKFE